MAFPTISERYEKLRHKAETDKSQLRPEPRVRRELRIALPSLAAVSGFPAGSRVRYNDAARTEWRAHSMIGTVLGFTFKREYRDKHIYLEADWLVKVEWDDDIGEHPIHPDWLEIFHNNP